MDGPDNFLQIVRDNDWPICETHAADAHALVFFYLAEIDFDVVIHGYVGVFQCVSAKS